MFGQSYYVSITLPRDLCTLYVCGIGPLTCLLSDAVSGLISAVIPGAGYSLARQAKMSFTIRDGVIHTDDFKVSGKLFGMVGHGDIHFLEDACAIDRAISRRVRSRKSPAVLDMDLSNVPCAWLWRAQ